MAEAALTFRPCQICGEMRHTRDLRVYALDISARHGLERSLWYQQEHCLDRPACGKEAYRRGQRLLAGEPVDECFDARRFREGRDDDHANSTNPTPPKPTGATNGHA